MELNKELIHIIKVLIPDDIIIIILSFCEEREYQYLTTWDPRCKNLLENETLFMNILYRKMVPSIYGFKDNKEREKLMNEIRHAFSLFKYLPLEQRTECASMYMNYPLSEEDYPPIMCIEANSPLVHIDQYIYIAADMGKERTLIDALETEVNIAAIAIYYRKYGFQKTKELLSKVTWKLRGINSLFVNPEIRVLLRKQFTESIIKILETEDERLLRDYSLLTLNKCRTEDEIEFFKVFMGKDIPNPKKTFPYSILVSCIFNYQFDLITPDHIQYIVTPSEKILFYYAMFRDNRIDLLDELSKIDNKKNKEMSEDEGINIFEDINYNTSREIKGENIYVKIIEYATSDSPLLDYILDGDKLGEWDYANILTKFLHPRIIEKIALSIKKKYDNKRYFNFIEPDVYVKHMGIKPFASYIKSIFRSLMTEDEYNKCIKDKEEEERKRKELIKQEELKIKEENERFDKFKAQFKCMYMEKYQQGDGNNIFKMKNSETNLCENDKERVASFCKKHGRAKDAHRQLQLIVNYINGKHIDKVYLDHINKLIKHYKANTPGKKIEHIESESEDSDSSEKRIYQI